MAKAPPPIQTPNTIKPLVMRSPALTREALVVTLVFINGV
jgi:hypothetical protein